MADDTDNMDDNSLKLIIEEQRHNHDYLLRIYERAGSKENVLLTAAFGILIYLYSSPSNSDGGIMARLSIPTEDYGIVIYVIAVGFFIFGLFRLMLSVFGDSIWETPYETSKKDYLPTANENLKYIKKRHDESMLTNRESYDKRKNNLRLCFFSILISAIILIVIKTLG